MFTYALLAFIRHERPETYSLIESDVYSVYRAYDRRCIEQAILNHVECRIVFYLRAASIFQQGPMARIIGRKYKDLSSRYCINISPKTRIGRGFRIGHIGNITVHSRAVLGCFVTVSQGVTIGKIHKGSKSGVPALGNEVYLAPNAVVVGNITIGDNVMVSANAFVNIHVPSNSIILGNPGTVHHSPDATKGIINCRP